MVFAGCDLHAHEPECQPLVCPAKWAPELAIAHGGVVGQSWELERAAVLGQGEVILFRDNLCLVPGCWISDVPVGGTQGYASEPGSERAYVLKYGSPSSTYEWTISYDEAADYLERGWGNTRYVALVGSNFDPWDPQGVRVVDLPSACWPNLNDEELGKFWACEHGGLSFAHGASQLKRITQISVTPTDGAPIVVELDEPLSYGESRDWIPFDGFTNGILTLTFQPDAGPSIERSFDCTSLTVFTGVGTWSTSLLLLDDLGNGSPAIQSTEGERCEAL